MSSSAVGSLDRRGLGTLSWALAFVGVLCIVSPVSDWVLTNLPLEVSRLTWRYQALGRLSQSLLTPILGVTLIVGAGAVARSRWLCALGAAISIMGVLALLSAAAVFLLDMSGAQQQVRPEAMDIFRIGALRAVGKFALATAALALLGWAGLSLGRALRASTEQEKKKAGAAADSVVFRPS